MATILLVEDAREFQKIVVRALSPHEVICVESVADARAALREKAIHLILLDINLPGEDGYSLLSELQDEGRLEPIPVLCLTGRGEVSDKVAAFTLGADDYIVKPFDLIEFKARVQGRLDKRERLQNRQDRIIAGNLEIDRVSHRVLVQKDGRPQEVPMTQTEFKLLSCLTRRIGQVFTREQLLNAAWGEETEVLHRAVDVHICGLRRKLGVYGRCIEAVPGTGYRFKLPEKSKSRKAA